MINPNKKNVSTTTLTSGLVAKSLFFLFSQGLGLILINLDGLILIIYIIYIIQFTTSYIMTPASSGLRAPKLGSNQMLRDLGMG
jgi:hypothetical protein